MTDSRNNIETLGNVLEYVEAADLESDPRRDMKSAITRVAEMAGVVPSMAEADAPALRTMLKRVRPAAHGVKTKTWANLISQLRAALRLAGVIDPRAEGLALKDPAWAPLLELVADDKRLSCGLAAFANYCARRGITPHQVDDAVLQQFHVWLVERTLCPRPKDVVRRVPKLWNEASKRFEGWPKTKLTTVSFKSPQRWLRWSDLAETLRSDAEAYIAMRSNPDIFDERPNAPKKPLAASTLRQQREHLRLAASVLIESGIPAKELTSLVELVQPEAFKTILRHYHEGANRQPNAFVTVLAKTIIQVAQFFVGVSDKELDQLKRFARQLPSVPFDLTSKNKALLRQFESERLMAKLLFLPEQLQAEAAKALATGRLPFVEAQMAIAIDIQLATGLRPQNLIALNWRRHFAEPDGPTGPLLLVIPAAEMKSRKDDFVAEVPSEVARRFRWYRRVVLPRLGADPDGDLFVTANGIKKDQRTLTIQMLKTVERRLGIHMTTHQYRHLLGSTYLDANPHDTETARLLLGHAWTKTTRIYVGSQTRRASRAYNTFLIEQREKLKLKRTHELRRKLRPNNKQQKQKIESDSGAAPCAD